MVPLGAVLIRRWQFWRPSIVQPGLVLLLVLVLLSDGAVADEGEPCECGNGAVKLFGPGGPHTALVPTAHLFNIERNDEPKIEICFGPEETWRERARLCGAGLFAAAEQQMSGFLRVFGPAAATRAVDPITMHASVLVVPAGNPLQIEDLDDVIARPGLRIVVNDGNFRDSLTSGTALWEDVVGRTGSVRAVAAVRSKIVAFAAGSGEARDMILSGEADVWFTWHDWWVGNREAFHAVPIGPERAIARDLTVVPFLNTSYLPPCEVESVIEYIDFVRDSTVANLEMELAGWFKEDVFERTAAAIDAHAANRSSA
jgi:accessory colonization factor AcfC